MVVGATVVDVVVEVDGGGGNPTWDVVDVVVGSVVVVAGPPVPVVPSGAASLNGTAACSPPITYTGVPFGTWLGNHVEMYIGIRTQPCDAGYPGTEGAPWIAMPPLKYSGL